MFDDVKTLSIHDAVPGQGAYYVAFGESDEGETVEIRWRIKPEYLEADACIPDDLQLLCDWEHPDQIYIDNVPYFEDSKLVI